MKKWYYKLDGFYVSCVFGYWFLGFFLYFGESKILGLKILGMIVFFCVSILIREVLEILYLFLKDWFFIGLFVDGCVNWEKYLFFGFFDLLSKDIE